ncbi:hypothetical protein AFCDBAGC_0083 [Methylobacterium cerastii]|uniref:Uncharacterized protein n=1 Tax=Methylobacterium cerastii TaxID=932741 RepID=A0ABQ4QAK7_9HYPH|nr:hypothetical protein [Methylobacterium cerastii]GJD42248.1 hypothetical protein AFCDBAGC_0083 [Methylobacterium cerastii]
MTALHHHQVRRARRLPVPLPPKPKRPLGPPVVCWFRGVSIRVRADVEKAGVTWDEFLDELAGEERLPPLHLVTTLVPGHERHALAKEIVRRRRAIQKARREGAVQASETLQAFWDARAAERGAPLSILERLFGRPAS